MLSMTRQAYSRPALSASVRCSSSSSARKPRLSPILTPLLLRYDLAQHFDQRRLVLLGHFANDRYFDDFAQVPCIEHFLDRNLAYVSAALRAYFEQPFFTELDERFAHRLPAYREALSHVDFRNRLAGNEVAADDRRAQDAMQLGAD